MTKEQAQKEFTIGNNLIAKFMGAEISGSGIWVCFPNRNPKLSGDLGYHFSWDELMPVIEKISAIKWGEDTDSPDTYYPRTFGMLSPETGKPMFRFNLHGCFEADTLIEAAWLCVVEFIKWYEENKEANASNP